MKQPVFFVLHLPSQLALFQPSSSAVTASPPSPKSHWRSPAKTSRVPHASRPPPQLLSSKPSAPAQGTKVTKTLCRQRKDARMRTTPTPRPASRQQPRDRWQTSRSRLPKHHWGWDSVSPRPQYPLACTRLSPRPLCDLDFRSPCCPRWDLRLHNHTLKTSSPLRTSSAMPISLVLSTQAKSRLSWVSQRAMTRRSEWVSWRRPHWRTNRLCWDWIRMQQRFRKRIWPEGLGWGQEVAWEGGWGVPKGIARGLKVRRAKLHGSKSS